MQRDLNGCEAGQLKGFIVGSWLFALHNDKTLAHRFFFANMSCTLLRIIRMQKQTGEKKNIFIIR